MTGIIPTSSRTTDASDTRVLLVDDNPAMLRQVVDLLPEGFDVVEQLPNGAGLPAAVRAPHPDVVVLDVTLPGPSGFVLAAQLKGLEDRPRIVFLTVHDDPDYLRMAFDVGASAYVVKMRLSQDLVPARP